MTPAPGVIIVAVLSLGYLCSNDIFSLINYVGFATWVNKNTEKHNRERDYVATFGVNTRTPQFTCPRS